MNNRLLRVLSIKPFLYLWLAEIFSQIAGNMVNFVLLVLAFDLASSNTAVSGIVLSFTIPAIVFGLLAGILVDRSDKKRVLFITNFLRALLLLLLAVFHSNLLFLYIFSFFISIITQFFIPAETPMIAHVVNKTLLFPANALFGMGIYGSILVGYALSGVFLIVFGSTYVFIALAFFFLIASFFISRIRISGKIKESLGDETVSATFKEEVKDAIFAIIKTKQVYKSLFLLSLSQILILVLSAIGPGFAKQVLKIQVNQFSIFFVAPSAIGMILGALFIGNFFHGKSKHRIVTLGLFVSSISILLLSLGTKTISTPVVDLINLYLPQIFRITTIHLVVIISFVLGVANALVFVPSNTILQEETASHMRGKMYGLLNSLVGIFSLFPIILAGGLADLVGVPNVLIGIGAVIFIIGLIHAFFK